MKRVIISIIFCFVNVMASKCPSSWAHAGRNLFLKSVEYLNPVTFSHASSSCAKQNATIVYPRTQHELESLQKFAHSVVDKLQSSTKSLWLNIEDDLNEGSYQSIGEDVHFLEWDTGEPRNSIKKNCVVLDLKSIKFKMVDCLSKASFVCQLSRAACTDGYEPIGDKCLKITNSFVTGHNAASTCTNAKGKVPLPKSYAELQVYDDFWNSRENANNAYFLAISFYSSRWRTFYPAGVVATYIPPWHPGEPNRICCEHCMVSANMKVANIQCNYGAHVFCEGQGTLPYWDLPMKNGFTTRNITTNSMEYTCQSGFTLRGNDKSAFDETTLEYIPSMPPICEEQYQFSGQRVWLSKKGMTIKS